MTESRSISPRSNSSRAISPASMVFADPNISSATSSRTVSSFSAMSKRHELIAARFDIEVAETPERSRRLRAALGEARRAREAPPAWEPGLSGSGRSNVAGHRRSWLQVADR